MLVRSGIVALLLLVGGGGGWRLGGERDTHLLHAQELDRTVAVIRLHETTNISRSELRRRTSLLEEQVGRPLSESETDQLLEAMVSAELLKMEAEKLSIRVTDSEIDRTISQQRQILAQQNNQPIESDQFRRIIEEQTNIGWDDYREQIKNRLVQEKYIFQTNRELFSAIRPPTSEEIENYYDSNATQFTNPAIVHVQFLLIPTRNVSDSERESRRSEANELLQSSTASLAAFEQARKNSLDQPNITAGEVLLLRGNDTQGELYGNAFVNSLFELEGENFVPRIIESRLGFHVVRVIDRRAPKILDLDDPVLPGQSTTVRDQVSNRLLLEKQQEVLRQAVSDSLEDLRERADVTIYRKNI